MKLLDKSMSKPKERPIKVVQFGEGNFLRAFVDYMIDISNEKELFDGSIVLLKPIEFGSLSMFDNQECQYTVTLRGKQEGKEVVEHRVITSVADAVSIYDQYDTYMVLAKLDSLRFVVSNTTEAGIVYDESDLFELNPPNTFPGKLTKFLYERYQAFQGDVSKGLIILPVELIDDNGIVLKECVFRFAQLWNLESGFVNWLEEACVFCSTLVDRIVTGYPREEAPIIWEQLGYEDNLLVTAEPFGLWVIESDKDIKEEFPLDRAGLPVIFTDNQKPYKQRKVRILNGAHTAFVLASYLAGNDYVKESMEDEVIRKFMNAVIYEEVIPTLTLPKEELIAFADSVVERFENPYIKHELLSISLNSVSKWRARCLPSLLEYVEMYHKLPKHLAFSIAALMSFYSGSELKDNFLIATREDNSYAIKDDKNILEFFAEFSHLSASEFTRLYLSNTSFHGQDLTEVAELCETVTRYLVTIRQQGMRRALELLEEN